MGGVSSVSAGVWGWCESYFDIGPVGTWIHKILSKIKKMAGVEILVWVKHMIFKIFVMIL